MKFKVIINEEKRTIEVVLENGARGKAKCMCTDHFSYDVGITLALERARVTSKTQETSANPTIVEETKAVKPFTVDERVRFKSWDKMCKECSANPYSDIKFPNGEFFVKEMAELCGTYATIASIDNDGYVQLAKMSAGNHWVDKWLYTLDMLEHIT